MLTPLPAQRDRGDFEMTTASVERLDPHRAERRSLLLCRDTEREIVGWNRRTVFVGRSESGGPNLVLHRTGFVEASAEQLLRRFVVEQQVAVRIDDEDRRREMARQLSHQ